MTDRTTFLVATAAAVLCFLIAGVGRPMLDYLTISGGTAAMLTSLLAASIAGLIGGGVALLVAIAAMERLGLSPACTGTRRRRFVVVMVVVAGAVIATTVVRSRLQGDAALFFTMAVHALVLIPAIWAAILFRRGLQRAR